MTRADAAPDLVGGDLAAAWDDLADRLGASPFQRPGWFGAWWSAFGGRGRPEILCSHRDGRLAGVLPIRCRLGAVDGLSNEHTFRYGPLAEDATVAAELVQRALGRARRRIAFGHLLGPDAESVGRALREHGCAVRSFRQQRSPYIDVAGGFEEFRGRLDARWLRQLERRRAKLASGGPVELDVLDGRDDLETVLAEAFRLESLGWKSEAGTAIVSQAATHHFYAALFRWAAARGVLRVAFLRVGGTPVAVDLALEDRGAHYFLKTGFDPEHRTHAPGLILRHDMIERAFRTGLRSYEMLGDAERYKLQWTDDTHDVQRLVGHPATALGRGNRAAGTLVRAARGRASALRTRIGGPARAPRPGAGSR